MRYLLFFIMIVGLHLETYAQLISNTKVTKLMGSRFEITAVAPNDTLSWLGINAGIQEIQRIENLISSWDPKSQTSAINSAAGIKAVKVDRELIDLIFRAKKVSRLTAGAFDISYASMDRLWKFDGSMKEMPHEADIKKSIAFINYENIVINQEDQTVMLKDKGMKIGFGAIGKGYAANRAREVMKDLGIANGLVNAGGDLIAWGKQKSGAHWRIGITDPNQNDKVYSWLTIKEQSVVTSGDYERFIILDGKRYAHIIDPRTGYPVPGIKSVTIVSPDAELSDALATSVFVMGEQQGLALINKLNGIECLIVTEDNRMVSSDNLLLNYVDK